MQKRFDSTPTICLDIETVPHSLATLWVERQPLSPSERFQSIDPPLSVTSLKDLNLRQDRIDQWKKSQEEKANQEILQKRQKMLENAGLKWWTGKIICIGTWNSKDNSFRSFIGDDEVKLLNEFMDYVTTEGIGSVLCGKQSRDFDIPFIAGRLMANNLGLSEHFRHYRDLTDINEIFGLSSQSGQRGKLSDYAFGIGHKGKTAHGSEVLGMYNLAILGDKSQWDRIQSYCMGDVEITVEVWKRYHKNFRVQETPSKPQPDVDLADIPF